MACPAAGRSHAQLHGLHRLEPGEVFDKAEVRAQKDTFKLQIPADGE